MKLLWLGKEMISEQQFLEEGREREMHRARDKL